MTSTIFFFDILFVSAIVSPDLSIIIVFIFPYSFFFILLANQLTGFNMKPSFSESLFRNRL